MLEILADFAAILALILAFWVAIAQNRARFFTHIFRWAKSNLLSLRRFLRK